MATINTNMAANIAANSMTRNERSMSSTMERLSTGIRINSAKDDAAGLAISSKMTSQRSKMKNCRAGQGTRPTLRPFFRAVSRIKIKVFGAV